MEEEILESMMDPAKPNPLLSLIMAYVGGPLVENLSYPKTPRQFERIFFMLADHPDMEKALLRLKDVSAPWKSLVDNWEDLCWLYLEEKAVGKGFSKLNRRLKKLTGEKQGSGSKNKKRKQGFTPIPSKDDHETEENTLGC